MSGSHRCSLLLSLVSLTFGLSGCIGVSHTQGAEGSADQGPPPGSTLKGCPGGTRAADDGLVDDFEDGNTQVIRIAARDGHWFKAADPNGSAFDPDELSLAEPGAGDSSKAIHVTGYTVTAEGAYGTLIGVNLTSGGLYDGSTYMGVSFKAKADPGMVQKVRFNVGDVNTHKDAGVCKSCWNHFGQEITLTGEWTEYTVLFADLRQEPGWGDPRPPSVTPEKLYSMDWSFKTLGVKFGFWLDDVSFVVCK